jgi:hypothetical protein
MNRRPLETRRLRADTLAEIRHQLRHISPPLERQILRTQWAFWQRQ